MATQEKKLKPGGYAADRELIAMAKTSTLAAIALKTGRKPEAIIKRAMRLGISVKREK